MIDIQQLTSLISAFRVETEKSAIKRVLCRTCLSIAERERIIQRKHLARTNIQYRLNSGRAQYVRNGGKLGRKTGTIKSEDKKREEYREVITLLKRGYSIRNTARLTGSSISTVQRIKNQFVR